MTFEPSSDVSINDFQQLIHKMYFEKDVARGVEGTFMWLMEEIGELSSALRSDDRQNLSEEFADVLAWLVTIANVAEIDLTQAVQEKYGNGCPGCSKLVCNLPPTKKSHNPGRLPRTPKKHRFKHFRIVHDQLFLTTSPTRLTTALMQRMHPHPQIMFFAAKVAFLLALVIPTQLSADLKDDKFESVSVGINSRAKLGKWLPVTIHNTNLASRTRYVRNYGA